MKCDRCLKYIRRNANEEFVDLTYGSVYCWPWPSRLNGNPPPMHISREDYVKRLAPEFGTGKARRLFYAFRILQSTSEVISTSTEPEALKTDAVKHALAMLTVPGKGI